MQLDIDHGNTRLKWRFQGSSPQAGTLEDLLRKVRSTRLTTVRMVSVVSAQRQRQLINSVVIASSLPITWKLAKSTTSCCGVVNGYKNPNTLGADRWCTIVAASIEYQPLSHGMLVLGCGTALTADFVNAQKHHLGGWIAPGKTALIQGLRQCVHLSFDVMPLDNQQTVAQDTNVGISLGCQTLFKGGVQQALGVAQELFGQNFVVVIHGGDSVQALEFLPKTMQYFHVAELVFDGLGYVCDQPKIIA